MPLALRILLLLGVLWKICSAGAETRVALIIGNGDYLTPGLKLANPINDAGAMQRALRSAGFETIVSVNAKRLDLYRQVDKFAATIGRDPHTVGLFYYAGHGVQVDGTNYLIPVDARIESVSDLEANAFDISRILRAMQEAQNDMNIVILDACRNNPLPRTRGIEGGLARMQAPSGTFIAYAAAPGQTAEDGQLGTNGVFTGELVKAMADVGLPIEQMFKKVIASVRVDTHGRQQPWSEASVQGDFYFHPVAANAPERSGVAPDQVELAYWQSIQDSRNAADFQAYLKKYPHGEFADLAANRVKLSTVRQSALPSQKVSVPTGNPAPTAMKPKLSAARCQLILDRAQLGDTLSEEDRTYLKEECQ